MTNHPTRSQKSQDAAIRRLLLRFKLSHLDMTITHDGAYARAIPASWNPVIMERREAAFAGRDHSLAEAARLREEFMRQVAAGHGKTIEDAIVHVAAELAKALPALAA